MSINSKMTAIADEIRTLSGTTGTMGLDAMAMNIGDANGEVSTQTNLLAQIASVLEGKAAGGGSSGGLEYVTGSFWPSYALVGTGGILKTVTGIGFKPSFVMVYLNDEIAADSTLSHQRMFLAAAGNLQNIALFNYGKVTISGGSSSTSLTLTGDTSSITLSMDEDGFTIYNMTEEMFIPVREYAYIAIK